jgi:predicted transcriptional regulator
MIFARAPSIKTTGSLELYGGLGASKRSNADHKCIDAAVDSAHNALMTLTKEQNARVRAELRDLLGTLHGSKTGVANHLGVSQAQISLFLAGKSGAGMKLLSALSRRSGKPIDEILGRQAPDLAEENYNLKDELAYERQRNAALVSALEEVLDAVEEVVAKHRKTLRANGR